MLWTDVKMFVFFVFFKKLYRDYDIENYTLDHLNYMYISIF